MGIGGVIVGGETDEESTYESHGSADERVVPVSSASVNLDPGGWKGVLGCEI